MDTFYKVLYKKEMTVLVTPIDEIAMEFIEKHPHCSLEVIEGDFNLLDNL